MLKGAPVLPSEKDRDEHEVPHATFRSWCEAVCGRACNERFSQAIDERIRRCHWVAMDYRFFGRDTDADVATILVLVQRPHGAVSPMQWTACWLTSTHGVWLRCCSRRTTNPPSRHLSTEFGPSEARRSWWREFPSARTGQTEQPRTQREGSRASPEPMCACFKRSSATWLTARASCCHGSCDTRRVCSVDSSSETTVAALGPGWEERNVTARWHRSPLTQGAASANTLAQESAPRRAGPCLHRSQRIHFVGKPAESQQDSFSIDVEKRRIRCRRCAIPAAVLTPGTHLCSLSASASLTHSRKLSAQSGLSSLRGIAGTATSCRSRW